jgi:hypothetical protein
VRFRFRPHHVSPQCDWYYVLALNHYIAVFVATENIKVLELVQDRPYIFVQGYQTSLYALQRRNTGEQFRARCCPHDGIERQRSSFFQGANTEGLGIVECACWHIVRNRYLLGQHMVRGIEQTYRSCQQPGAQLQG